MPADGTSCLDAFTGPIVAGLWRLLSGNRLRWFCTVFFAVAGGFTNILFFFLLRRLIDTVLSDPGMHSQIPVMALQVFLTAAAEGIFLYFTKRLTAATTQNILYRLRTGFFSHMQSIRLSEADRFRTGDLTERMTGDIEAVGGFYANQLLQAAEIIIVFIINFLAIMSISRSLALVAISAGPFLLILSTCIFGLMKHRWADRRNCESDLTSVISENLAGIRIVRATGRHDTQITRFDETNRKTTNAMKRLAVVASWYWALTSLPPAIQQILGLAVGGTYVLREIITVGSFIAYIGLMRALIAPFRTLGDTIVRIAQVRVSFSRLGELARLDSEAPSCTAPGNPSPLVSAVSFRNVSFRYHTDDILHNISFTVPVGSWFGIIGPTASGKSTIVKLLLGLYSPHTGIVEVLGIPLLDGSLPAVRDRCAAVLQEPRLFDGSIEDNITMGARPGSVAIEEALRTACMAQDITALPEGIATNAGVRGMMLSGGQRQRIGLARSLYRDRPILILDDITASVDTDTENAIMNSLRHTNPEKTVIITSHRIATIRHCDAIMVVRDGRIESIGSHESLQRESPFYRKVCELQEQSV